MFVVLSRSTSFESFSGIHRRLRSSRILEALNDSVPDTGHHRTTPVRTRTSAHPRNGHLRIQETDIRAWERRCQGVPWASQCPWTQRPNPGQQAVAGTLRMGTPRMGLAPARRRCGGMLDTLYIQEEGAAADVPKSSSVPCCRL